MTPLTAMRGYIETLSMSELQIDAPTRERYLQIVSEETHRLERIVGDLLDLARLEGGGTTHAAGTGRRSRRSSTASRRDTSASCESEASGSSFA